MMKIYAGQMEAGGMTLAEIDFSYQPSIGRGMYRIERIGKVYVGIPAAEGTHMTRADVEPNCFATLAEGRDHLVRMMTVRAQDHLDHAGYLLKQVDKVLRVKV